VSDERRENPTERLLAPQIDEAREFVPELSRRSAQRQRSLEAYFKAGDPPRWMTRVTEIENGIAAEKRKLERVYRSLQEQHPDGFAERWREIARTWRFDELNDLIAEHNEWYPVERRLAVDLRTRDYVLVNGRSYRRPILGPEWILEHFPV
jgi:hypothetical protein